MTSILKSIEKPFSSTEKKISKEADKLEDNIENAVDTAGNYLLFGVTVGVLVLIPFVNYVSGKIPDLIDQGAKIANIVKPI